MGIVSNGVDKSSFMVYYGKFVDMILTSKKKIVFFFLFCFGTLAPNEMREGILSVLLFFLLLGSLPKAHSALQISEFSQIESLPSRIFLTDSNEAHLGLVLNACKNYIALGGNPDQLFVLTYGHETEEYLHTLGINTFFFPDITNEIQQKTKHWKCYTRHLVKAHFMGVVMELKIRLWLEFCRLEKQFMVFDSDVVFHQHPDALFRDALAKGTSAPDIIAAYYTGIPNLAQQTGADLVDNILDGVDGGYFELNFSPSVIINPKKMYPILTQMFDLVHRHTQRKCGTWGYGWGQTLPNIILYRSGLRWKQDEVGEMAQGIWMDACGPEKAFCLDGGRNESMTGKEREEYVGRWEGVRLTCHYFVHYAGQGGWIRKSKEILDSGDWYLPCEFAQSSFTMELLWEAKDTILNPDYNCRAGPPPKEKNGLF